MPPIIVSTEKTTPSKWATPPRVDTELYKDSIYLRGSISALTSVGAFCFRLIVKLSTTGDVISATKVYIDAGSTVFKGKGVVSQRRR